MQEWNETVTETRRGLRGGLWGSSLSGIQSNSRQDFTAGYESSTTGFRIAAIPEPTAAALFLAGLVLMAKRRRQACRE